MLCAPYRNELIDLQVEPSEAAELISLCLSLPSVRITRRELCDLEMLAVGAFSPLRTFMGADDYKSVVETMRLADGTLFPIPINLTVDDIADIELGSDIALRSPNNDLLALMSISEIYESNRSEFAKAVLGTSDLRHPMVAELSDMGRYCLSGPLRVIKLPEYHDFRELRMSPIKTRKQLKSLGDGNVVAFHTRNPLHRAHEEMMKRGAASVGGTLLLHPTVGLTKPGDVEHVTRVRTYKAFIEHSVPREKALLGIIPLAMRMAGPREALFHAIVRRNYGASHFIIGRDHASPGADSKGQPFYPPFAAQELAEQHSEELGIEMITFPELRYFPADGKWKSADVPELVGRSVAVSGTSIRNDLGNGVAIPRWSMQPATAEILSDAFPPKHKQGVCIWFTGLSASGKSTTAEILTVLLQEEGRQVSLLDGDVVRTHLSKGLGFSKEDRNTNVSRIGFVASEIVRHGGIAICAAISPYRESRNSVRTMFEPGKFTEVFVSTPLEVCESRDPKGMYAMSRRGDIENFTGTDDTYEIPEAPEITLETVDHTARENAERIIEYLRHEGFLKQQLRAAAGASRNGGTQ